VFRKIMLCFALAAAGTAQAQDGRSGDPLLCLGRGFTMIVDGSDVFFDYLGDGGFTLDPAIEGRALGFSTHELVTQRERWTVYLEERSCSIIGATLPVRIEVAVPTSAGLRPLVGCCKWQYPAE